MTISTTTKTCRLCGDSKSLDEFHNSVSAKDGKYARCKACVLAKNTEWRLNNKGKVAKSKKDYSLHHAEAIKRKAKDYRSTDRYQENMADYRRKWNLAKRYGITIEEYEAMYARSDGKCELCNHQLSFGRGESYMACVDHDHATGVVRGILCRKCNQALGTFQDSIEGLERAIDYLRMTEARNGK